MQAVQKDIMEKQDALRGYMTDINTQKEELDKRLDDDSKLDPIRRIQMRNEIKNLTTQVSEIQHYLMPSIFNFKYVWFYKVTWNEHFVNNVTE